MNGYSKMRASSNKKTRSMDFSDLLSSPPHKQPLEETKENSSINPQSPECQKGACQKSSSSVVAAEVEDEERDATPARTGSNLVDGVKLTRTCSVAAPANYYYSSSSPRFRSTRTRTTSSSGIQSTVKRVFSMRRSSSVSEKYCRIYDHHQHVEFQPEPEPDFDDAVNDVAVKTRTEKKNGILKACKRLLGF